MAAALVSAFKPPIMRPKPKYLPRQQSTVRGFTTDDTDVFTAHSGNHNVAVETSVCQSSTLTMREKSQEEKLMANERKSRRRSKSVGAPDFNFRLLPAYSNSSGQSSKQEDSNAAGESCNNLEKANGSTGDYNNLGKDPSQCKNMIAIMKGLDFPGAPLAANHTSRIQSGVHQTASDGKQSYKKLKSAANSDQQKPPTIAEIPPGAGHDLTEEQPPTSGHFAKKRLSPDDANTGLSKKLTRRLSRKLTGRMTKRQRQELMLEGEFDEFDVGGSMEADETNDVDDIVSPPQSDDESSVSDDTDHEFETEIVTQLNIQRITVDDGVGSDEESCALKMTKTQRIATELLTTERSYVQNLHLLDQIFHLRVVFTNREYQMFPDNVIPRIFSNIKSIYQFHNDFLLPQLEKRMSEWDAEPRIGDVMRKFAPFLKLYSEYVKNFDCAMKMINFWTERSPRFGRLLLDIQSLPECGHLTLQHHMLGPIQRVPRYQLLLKDYLKHLLPDSNDLKDTEKALELVTMAATHSNDAMRKIEKFRKLLNVNESLAGMIDLISPGRELIREGKIIRISAKDGDHIERYLFLFNDLLLVCQSLPLIIGAKQQFKIKSKIDIQGLQIFEGHNLETPNTFYVQGQQKSIELHTSTVEEKQEWQNAFETVIADYNQKRSYRKASLKLGTQIDREIVGKVPPVWIKDQETSMCMNCTTTFTTFRRRHHCRACGHVICGKCSSRKAPLLYDDNNVSRVCDPCFEILCPGHVDRSSQSSKTLPTQTSLRSQQQPQQPAKKTSLILQVKASDSSVLSGYLNITCNKKTWLRRWFSVRENYVLYSFKAHQDVVALTALPLPGYQVLPVVAEDGIDREQTFKMFHKPGEKVYYLQAEDETNLRRWVDVLQLVVSLKLPSTETQPESPSPLTGGATHHNLDSKVQPDS